MKPSLAIATICRNEERDLPRMLRSIAKLNAQVFIVDTGSTDRTIEIAESFGAHVRTYTGASKQNAEGEWQLWDFGKARNEALSDAYASDTTHVMWIDADDVLITPDAIKRAMYRNDIDVAGCWIDGGNRWIQHRIFRTSKRVMFKGRCHEYPILDGLRIATLDDSLIIHHADPTPGETSNARNLRILTEEWTDEPTARTAFYLANTHRDGERHEKAATWYVKRLEMGVGYRDEWLFAMLYCARSYRRIKHYKEAKDQCRRGMEEAPTWAEFPMELAFILYEQKHYTQTIDIATPCLTMQPPRTDLWREPNMYSDQPARIISWCHEHMGNYGQALTWAEEARRRIGKRDDDWEARICKLQGLNAPKAATVPRICLNRPGAIGDILMTLNLIPALKEANPGHQISYFCDEKLAAMDQLGSTIIAAGCDKVLPSSQFDAGAERAINLVGYPLAEGYPEKPMRDHLLHYFAREMGVGIDPRTTPMPTLPEPDFLPALTLRRPERAFGCTDSNIRYATVQIKAGWSKYKEWPLDRWIEVMRQIEDEIPVYCLGADNDPVVSGRAFLNRDNSLAQSIKAFANARMHIGIDSFCNHLTNYRWQTSAEYGEPPTYARVPGVILWGSTQASAAGYPHNTNISKGLPCQPCFRENPAISSAPRGACINVAVDGDVSRCVSAKSYDDPRQHVCMAAISVDEVVTAIRKMWERVK